MAIVSGYGCLKYFLAELFINTVLEHILDQIIIRFAVGFAILCKAATADKGQASILQALVNRTTRCTGAAAVYSGIGVDGKTLFGQPHGSL